MPSNELKDLTNPMVLLKELRPRQDKLSFPFHQSHREGKKDSRCLKIIMRWQFCLPSCSFNKFYGHSWLPAHHIIYYIFYNSKSMGNSQNQHQISLGIKEYIVEQFNRLKKDTNRNHLTITEVMQAKHPEDYPFDFRHIGILYVCDHDLDGVFSLKDFEMFALWVQINMHSIQMYEFQAQLQAKTVAKMIEDIEKKDGESDLIVWFIKMLIESHRRKKFEGQFYIIIDGIKTIYEVFNVQMMTDMDIQSFFYLVKKSSEEMGFKIEEVVEQDEEEEYIAIRICEEFIKFFFKGILKLLKDIGYTSHVM